MSNDQITRSAMQALWGHLPEQPYHWGPDRVAVVGRSPRTTSPLDLPEEWVAPQLRRLIRPFAQQRSGQPNTGPELEVIERQQYELVTVDELNADRFPNTFLCRSCGHFTRVNTGDAAPACPSGHGPMPQFQWAEVHNCGVLRELSAPRCTNGCAGPMQLQNWQQLSVGQWFWRCSKCRRRSDTGVIRFCTECRSGRASVERIPRTSVHYPQSLTVLNPPDRATYASLAGEDVRAAAAGQLIGAVPPGLEALRAAAGSGGDDALTKVKATIAALGLTEDDPMYGQLIARAQQQASSPPSWRGAVDGLGLDPETLEIVGDEALALARAAAAKPLTVDDLIASPPAASLVPTYHQYRQLFDRYHLQDVTLLRELPVAHIVAGYTRMSATCLQRTRSGDRPTWFKFFPNGRSDRFPMYGKRTTTEGLLVRIDPLKVIAWLVDSGVVPDPGVTDTAAAHRWLLSVCPPAVDVFNPPGHQITAAVLGLVHSMSHRLMKALAARCGLHIDSLAEYLFPSAASFLIYANTRSEFTLGGIEHVFRFDLADALEDLDADPRCVFDPPCRRSFGGACAACLHTSEVACERFNTMLDRNLLFGTLPAPVGTPAPVTATGGTTWRAFWTR
jgi:hypothetical protein